MGPLSLYIRCVSSIGGGDGDRQLLNAHRCYCHRLFSCTHTTHSPLVVLDILIDLSLEFGFEREDVIHAELIHICLQRSRVVSHT